MKTEIHHSRAGLKIIARLPAEHNGCRLILDGKNPLVLEDACFWADGTRRGFASSATRTAVTALANWLCPSIDSMETRKAQYCQWNRETGEIQAAIYPEFAADVLRKLYRLKPRHLEFHTVSL